MRYFLPSDGLGRPDYSDVLPCHPVGVLIYMLSCHRAFAYPYAQPLQEARRALAAGGARAFGPGAGVRRSPICLVRRPGCLRGVDKTAAFSTDWLFSGGSLDRIAAFLIAGRWAVLAGLRGMRRQNRSRKSRSCPRPTLEPPKRSRKSRSCPRASQVCTCGPGSPTCLPGPHSHRVITCPRLPYTFALRVYASQFSRPAAWRAQMRPHTWFSALLPPVMP